MIKKFNYFSDDFLFESLINESILYFSPVFKSKLQGLPNSEIAKIYGVQRKSIWRVITNQTWNF